MTLLLLLLIPLCAGLLCLMTSSRTAWERLNLVAFAAVTGLAFKVASDVSIMARCRRSVVSLLSTH
jgi:hypothetical protein